MGWAGKFDGGQIMGKQIYGEGAVQASWQVSARKPGKYFVTFHDAFFGWSADCWAVVDDFGNLVRVSS